MKKLTYSLNIILGILVGLLCTYSACKALIVFNVLNPYEMLGQWIIGVYALACLVFAMFFVASASKMAALIKKTGDFFTNLFKNIPTSELILGIVGLIIGLLIATLLTGLYSLIPWIWLRLPLSVISYLIFGYLGVIIPSARKNDFKNLFKAEKKEKKKEKYQNAKVLDTSAVIDGRILEIMRSGFLEGTIIVTDLILNELRHIADYSDANKRNRGRRGLDLLKIMQDEFDKRIVVLNVSADYKDVEEVDEKLVMLTKDLKGKIITNDYNLNMMATVQKVPVLNINELAGSLKPNVMSGEKIDVEVVKKGKENGQGVAFLEDGTMIVIEDGAKYVGREMSVEITSIIQTASGRMIFAVAA
ncbi:MAG: hypothetical protein IJR47_02520 [Clostridia bacterium]|nr:hypothetical protein [Clostridia bacterium]